MGKFLLIGLLILATASGILAQANWTVLPHVLDNYLRSIHFSDEQNGYVTADSLKIYKTADGGLSWTDVSPSYWAPALNSHFSGICTTHPDTVYCVGAYGSYFIQSFDGGVTWDSIPTQNLIREVYFHNNIGFAHGNNMYRTTDGGVTWTQISTTVWTVAGMTFVNDSCAYAPSSNGAYYYTTDKGLNWTYMSPVVPSAAWNLHFSDEETGIICANSGNYSRTDDGGITWDSFSILPSLQLMGVHFINDTLVIMITPNSGSFFYLSYDAGLTFSTTGSYSCSGMTDLSFPNKCVGYISTLNGMIIKYQDMNPFCDQLGLSSTESISDLEVFPNPSSEQRIYLDEKFIGKQFEILDIQGRLVQSGFVESIELKLNNLSGTYILKILDGEITHAQRIIVY